MERLCLGIVTGFLLIGYGYSVDRPINQPDKNSVETLVETFLSARTPEQQKDTLEALLNANPSCEKMEGLLKTGRLYNAKVKTGWQIAHQNCRDGKSRPYHFWVPEKYEPAKKYPLIMFLHGAVSNPDILPDKLIKNMYNLWSSQDLEEFIYVIPATNNGAQWWNETGASYILDVIDTIKQGYNVDENRVYLSGFSDGASGAYYLALYHNTPFAGFIPLNGSLEVAEAGGGEPVYFPNLRNKPFYVVNTGKDPLYPADEIKPLIEAMQKAGVPVTFKVYPDIGHQLTYWKEERPLVLDFMNKNVRNPLPQKLFWETTNIKLNRIYWVQIDEIKNVDNNADLPDYNLMFTPKGVKLGVYRDEEYKGEGARIKDVVKKSLAEQLTLQKGDIIIQIDNTEIGNFEDLVKAIQAKTPGDKIAVKIKRNDETHEFEGEIPKAETRLLFSRDKTSGRIEVVAQNNRIDVKVKNVSRYTLFISTSQFNISKEIEIYTNDKLSFKGKVTQDLKFMLEQAGKDKDRTMVFCGKIEIER